MCQIYEYHLTVDDDEIDMLNHVNNVVYVKWLQSAALAHSAAAGWPTSRHLEYGYGWVTRWHHITYLLPACVGEKIVVRTWISSARRVWSDRRYQIFRLEENGPVLLATAETRWAFVKYDTGEPARIPPEIQEVFTSVDRALDAPWDEGGSKSDQAA